MPHGRVIQTFIILLLLAIPGGANQTPTESTEVEFHVYDNTGNRVLWKAFRNIQENRNAQGGDNDKLLDPVNLTVLLKAGHEAYGLYSSKRRPNEDTGDPVIEWPSRRVAVTLSLAWPTAEGYSNLMLDLPSPSASPVPQYPESQLPIYSMQGDRPVVIFNLLAAQRIVDNLDKALADRALGPFSLPYAPSPEYRDRYTSAYNSAKDNLRRAKSDGLLEKERGRLGELAFESATTATLLMLEDYGPQYARAQRGAYRPKWGVSLEGDIQQPTEDGQIKESTFTSVQEMVNCVAGDGWVRLIISSDDNIGPKYYWPALKWAHQHHLKVLGELRDSFDMCCTSKDQWQAHVRKYVDGLSKNADDHDLEADEWEVGNEVNGEWLVKKSDEEDRCHSCTGYAATADFIAFAAHYVKTKTDKPTMLTLFWQVGEDEPSSAMFNWLKDKLMGQKAPDGKSVLVYLDDIGLSLYPDKAPMGTGFNRIVSTLHNVYFTLPQHRLMLTELDYWPLQAEPNYVHVWRWGQPDLSKGSGVADFQRVRAQVATFYQSAVLGYPYSGGGTFWWYYLQEVAPDAGYQDNEIWKVLHSIHSKVVGSEIKCPSRIR